MTDTNTDPLRLQRLSECGRCPRMRVLHGRQFPKDEPSQELLGIWERGKQVEAYVVEQLKQDYEHDYAYAELEIVTPFGVIHPDLILGESAGESDMASTATVFEIKSTAGGLQPYHVQQLRAYLWGVQHQWPDAAVNGVVVTCNPSTLQLQTYPVEYTAEHAAQIEQTETHIRSLIQDEASGIPDRVCTHPNDGPSTFCSYVGSCFADWEPIPNDELPPALTAAAVDLAQKQAVLAALRKQVRELEAEVKTIVPGLADTLHDDGFYVGEGVTLKRSSTTRQTFSKAKAETAGVWTAEDDERFAPFLKDSTTVTLKATELDDTP